jgi:hypothetical protein
MIVQDMANAPVVVVLSRFLIELNPKNLDQLQHSGYDYFKRAVLSNDGGAFEYATYQMEFIFPKTIDLCITI